jgi:hypothetical protein
MLLIVEHSLLAMIPWQVSNKHLSSFLTSLALSKRCISLRACLKHEGPPTTPQSVSADHHSNMWINFAVIISHVPICFANTLISAFATSKNSSIVICLGAWVVDRLRVFNYTCCRLWKTHIEKIHI